jgi:hypothetical protein
LDSYLYAYNSGQTLLAKNDDSGSSLNSVVSINVTAGSTYYVKAAAYGSSSGAYTLQFSTTGDDFGNGFASAAALTLAANGTGSQSGRIDWAGDGDVFSFVAPVTGKMAITQSAASGSGLDSTVYAYNSGQSLLAQNDDNGSSLNSRVQIDVVAGQKYYVKALAYESSTGAYVLGFSTTASTTTPPTTPPTATPDPPPTTPATGSFQIDVTMSGMTAAQQVIVQQAAARWEQVIVGDLPDVRYLGRTIDDLALQVSASNIDGRGGILGQAAVTGNRSSRLPYSGYIQLDTADVAAMQANGSLLGVLVHEMGHLLGIGSNWASMGLVSGLNTSNPIFTGPRATAEYNAIFGTSAAGVPVETDGGGGTRLVHWDETTLGSELMTGWYNSGQTNPLSRITVASLADMGYQVNMAAADAYSPPGGVRSAAVAGSPGSGSSARDFPWTSHASRFADDSARNQRAVDQVLASGGWLI